jgi:hypothetical protein
MRLRGLVLMKLLDSIVQASVSFLFKMTISLGNFPDSPSSAGEGSPENLGFGEV